MSVLYELGDDPEVGLEAVLRAYRRRVRRSRPALNRLNQDIVDLLKDGGPEARAATQRIDAVYSKLSVGSDIRGALGGYLLLNIVTEAALKRSRSRGDLDAATTKLGDESVKQWIRSFYDLRADEYNLDRATVHEIGTTSFIVRCRKQSSGKADDTRELAVKCLLPRYIEVRAIRERTLRYSDEHSVPEDVGPEVHSSTATTITMDFVEGKTLAAVLAERGARDGVSTEKDRSERRVLWDQDITFIRELGSVLCEAL